MDSPKRVSWHAPKAAARDGRNRAARQEKKRMKRKVLVSRDGRYEMRVQAAHRHPEQVAVLRISRRDPNDVVGDVLHLSGEELLTLVEEKYGPMAHRRLMVNV